MVKGVKVLTSSVSRFCTGSPVLSSAAILRRRIKPAYGGGGGGGGGGGFGNVVMMVMVMVPMVVFVVAVVMVVVVMVVGARTLSTKHASKYFF
jgi:uncharacterized membrane protein